MKRFLLVLMTFLLPCAAMARQAQPAAADDGFQSLDEWMQDNIDPDVLKALKQLDQERVQRIFSELQLAMQGTNLYQLGTLRETATQLAPLLQKYQHA